ncbi:MAG: argininosuccinate synthase [Planctomycetes bacterium]|nr:argininosuccinate synthase [Planctomycetota bacterium]
MSRKVVLAYSGGLDTSAIVPWLKENHDCEVVCFAADVGQGADELAGIEDKAIQSGACDCYVVDLKREFVRDYVFPTIITGGVYEGRYLLGTAMARPIIAKAQVEIAHKVGADALAHGCTGKGNDQVRFESTYNALAPEMEVIAPWRLWDMRSREDLLEYLAQRNIKCSATAKKIYSRDRNLWHVSHEGGAIEDLWSPPPDDAWMMTVSPNDAPDEPIRVMLDFERGRPTAVDGLAMEPDELLAHLNDLGGRHGVGRVDMVENRLVGMKSRGLYETPGGTIVLEALRALEEIVLDRETLHFREHLGLTFAELVYNGRWFTPMREAISAAAESIASQLDGTIVVELYKGHATPVQRSSPNSLYAEEFATFGPDDVFDQKHSEGFIRLLSLPERIAGLKRLEAEQGAQA